MKTYDLPIQARMNAYKIKKKQLKMSQENHLKSEVRIFRANKTDLQVQKNVLEYSHNLT